MWGPGIGLALAILYIADLVNSAGLTLKYQPLNSKGGDQPSGVTLQVQDSSGWVWLGLGLLLGFLITAIVAIILRRCTSKPVGMGTIIALNIVGRQSARAIRVLSCHVPSSDIVMDMQQNAPSGLVLKGLINPKLQYSWTGHIIIKSLQITRPIPIEIAVSYAEAWSIRRIIRESYRVNAVAIERDRATVITLKARDSSTALGQEKGQSGPIGVLNEGLSKRMESKRKGAREESTAFEMAVITNRQQSSDGASQTES